MVRAINKIMDHAAIYHWWCENPNKKPYNFMVAPVVLSIATLRAFNKDLPTYVVDATKHVDWKPTDWKHFPDKLNFTVKKMKHRFPLPWSPTVNNRLCSRTWDVEYVGNQVPQNKIIAIDSDIFWLKDVFPLSGEKNDVIEKFSSKTNCGIYYYDKRLKSTERFFELWKGLMCLACTDDNFRKHVNEVLEIKKWGHSEEVFDERVLCYMIKKQPDLVFDIDLEENYIISGIIADNNRKIARMKKSAAKACLSFHWTFDAVIYA